MQFKFRLITVMEFDFCEFSGLKEVRSKITIPYWRLPEGFHFHWRGLKSHFFQFETLRMVIFNPLEGFRYLPRRFIIPLEGFRYLSRGFIIPLEGIRYLSRGFIIPLECKSPCLKFVHCKL